MNIYFRIAIMGGLIIFSKGRGRRGVANNWRGKEVAGEVCSGTRGRVKEWRMGLDA